MSRQGVPVAESVLQEPPHSIEAEHCVLGGLLLDNACFARVQPLQGGDFFDHEHRDFYGAIAALVETGRVADPITVVEWLKLRGDVAGQDGQEDIYYLQSLIHSIVSTSGIQYYAAIVRDKAQRRQLISVADQTRAAAYSATDANEARLQAQQLIADAMASSSHTTPARPVPLDFRALAGRPVPERQTFRAGWLNSGPTLLAGRGGGGKSTLLQHEATNGALGRPFFAPGLMPYKSAVWSCEEEHDELWRRQHRICEHEGVPMESLADRLFLVSRYGCDNALMAEVQGQLVGTRLLQELREQVNDLGIDALWLDNAAHVLLGDHDNRTHVTQFLNTMSGLVRGRPFAVIIVSHPGRAKESEFSGSVAWENAVRMRWYLGDRLPDQRPGEDDELARTDARFLCKRKSNYSAQDYVRFTMREGLLVPDGAAATHVGGVVSAMDERRAEELCVAGFKSLCGMGIRTTDGKTSPDYMPSQMVSKGLAAGYSKSEIGKAMNRLMGRGVFIRAPVGHHPNRSPKFGLVLKGEAS